MSDESKLHGKISGWLRQARLRAKSYGSKVELEMLDIHTIYGAYNYVCVYCGQPTGSPDLLFYLGSGAPLVPANVVPCCDTCKHHKRGKDVIHYHIMGYINRNSLDKIITDAMKRSGADLLKLHISRLIKE